MNRNGYVYLMMNQGNAVIYTGVTSDLKKRAFQHREDLIDGFTKRYRVHKLVYYECFDSIEQAIEREKQLKAGSRLKKLTLIRSENPLFEDLYDQI